MTDPWRRRVQDVELFHCERLHVRLTRKACAERHRKASAPPCGGCPIGAAHARGERPDVPLASVSPKGTKQAAETPREEVMEARTCRGCEKTFNPSHHWQKYCRTCKPAKTQPRASAKRKAAKAKGGDSPIEVAGRVVEQLKQLPEHERRKALRIVHVALDEGDEAA